jgi:hypothetical protein
MTTRYEIGRKVTIKPVKSQHAARDAGLEQYTGRIGVIANYYQIQPTGREVFCLYVVRIKDEEKEIVLYEDELQPALE